ncbi:MAG TPA: glycoside hydrolase family 38 C-terminal domain-containing protein [Gemmatimonadales bacterium]|nr:glycoside hydrolase family 38 C-terminal domain-containing protein [Gemmatimonadales bacterium]
MSLTFHLIPHTHWDREWYLTRTGFLARLVPVIGALLDQLERDPGARFVLDGQTVLLEDYLSVRPDRAARIAGQVRRGALEIGPWYIQSDLLIPAGESLIRNLLEGARDAARFGRRMDVLYCPDAFGHSGALPAIAREFGLGRAVVRRGLGRPGGRDRDFYRWTSRDGSALLAYHLPAPGYEVAIEVTRAQADVEREWAPVRADLTGRAMTGHVAVFVGADHHPVVKSLAGLRDRLQTIESGHAVRLSGLTELFDAAEPGLSGLPTVEGELRRIDGHTWVLQDVHSTRSRLKRRHGLAELELSRVTEPVAALAAWEHGRDARPLLRLAWRNLLQSQFHDTLCGSCADGVAREQEMRLESVETLNGEIGRQALHQLAGHDPDRAREEPERASPRLVLWNPAARTRSGITTAELTFFRRDVLVGPPGSRPAATGPGYEPFVLRLPDGTRTAVQVLALHTDRERRDAEYHSPDQDEVDRVSVTFRAPPVPGLGLAALSPEPGDDFPPDAGLRVEGGVLSNRYLTVRIADSSGLTLTDRRTGERYDRLCVIEDEGDRGDTYTFSKVPGKAARQLRPGASRTIAAGPLIGAVERTWSLDSAGDGGMELRLLVVMDADTPVVRIRLDLENGAASHRLRARFPVGAGQAAQAGAAFGAERRPAVEPDRRHGQIEQQVATAPAHRYVAAAGGRRGLAILSPVFFEYEWTGHRDLLVTLLRAVGELTRGDLPERPGHAGWPQPTPLAQEYGRHTIELALRPVTAAEVAEPTLLETAWEDTFLGLRPAFLRDYTSGDRPGLDALGATLEGPGLVLSAVKPAESRPGLVLRCWNAGGTPAEGAWRFARPLERAVLMRADETELRELPLSPDRRVVRFRAEPGRMVTICIPRGA